MSTALTAIFRLLVFLLCVSREIHSRRPTRQATDSDVGKCALPEEPDGGSFSVAGCKISDGSTKCRKVPGTLVETDTLLKYACKEGYTSTRENSKRILCVNGTWDPEIPKCLICGRSSMSVEQTQISGSFPAVARDYPWHVDLYSMRDGSYQQICGGTLLSPHVVLTAAHCTYDELGQGVMNPNELKVAAGKMKRSWYSNDPEQQQRDAREIIIPEKYAGYKTNYDQNIAIIDLVSPFILSDTVLPACLDKRVSEKYTPSKGALGTVVEWGITEERKPSELLFSTKLTYLDYDECIQKSAQNFKKFITHDKFCAAGNNGSSVHKWNGGGGFIFAKNNLHFVYGVAALKLRDDSFVVITNVTAHITWIENTMKAMSLLHP